MTTEEKLQHFYDFSMRSAENEAKQVLTEYQNTLDAQFKAHQEAKTEAAKRQFYDESVSAKREINKTISAEQLKIKRMLSQKESEIKDKLFAEVKDKLIAYKTSSKEDYVAFICKKITDAKDFAAGDEITVYIDPSDEALVKDIEANVDVTPTISKEEFIGGMRAVLPSKHILIDDSFATLMNEQKDNYTFDGGTTA